MDETVPAGAAILLDFIRQTEVSRTDRASYDVIYANKQGRLPKPLTSMTLDEVIKAQGAWSKNHGSSASGGYQFMRATLLGLMAELGLKGSQKLDPDLQDRLGYHLLRRRGYEAFMAGKIGRAEFGKRLAQEWASFPVLAQVQGAKRMLKRGQSFYAGDGLNKALVAAEEVEAILDRVRAAEGGVIVEKPIVVDPGELETPTTKSKTFWTWLLTAIGAPIAAFGNLDWRVQLAIVAAIVGFAIYGIKRRNDLFKAVKHLKAELGE